MIALPVTIGIFEFILVPIILNNLSKILIKTKPSESLKVFKLGIYQVSRHDLTNLIILILFDVFNFF